MDFLGMIYAWTGERSRHEANSRDIAIPDLIILRAFRLNPFWDSLRGDPRFEKIVEESKKPVALK